MKKSENHIVRFSCSEKSWMDLFRVSLSIDLHLISNILPRELVWKVWTTPAHLKQWFRPKPWETIECEIDLKPGGMFRTVMRSPDGNENEGVGCYLQIVENELLVWTDSLLPNFRPKDESFMTARLMLEDEGTGTKYTAIVLHKNEADRKKHEEMGFHQGWGTVVDQLVVYIKENLM